MEEIPSETTEEIIQEDADPEFEDLQVPELEEEEEEEFNNGSCEPDAGDISKLSSSYPFTRIHQTCYPLSEPNQNMWIPVCSVELRIVNVERDQSSTHIIHPNLYVIQLRHGDFEWTIKRRYNHFQQLHQQLRLYRASMAIPFPTKKHKDRRKSYREDQTKKRPLPRFPKKPESLLSQDEIDQRAVQLEDYLKNLLLVPSYRNHPQTFQFLEISGISFIEGLGQKGKEGLIYKRAGGHYGARGCLRLRGVFYECCSRWRKRWLIAKESFVAYIRPKDGVVKSVLLMDQGFQVQSGFMATGVNHGLLISNLTRNLLVKCWTKRKEREWKEFLLEMAKTTGKDFTQPNRYDSFVPVRYNVQCRWFIDGAKYCEAVADALEMAKEEIFITDWWLTPEIYLKRPAAQGIKWRLDEVLKRKAEDGVKIYILLYKEVEMALNINSLYSKQQLVRSHPNIRVLRHPDHVRGGVLLWAHHEKMVVIDQTFAFLGGLDLCYGRWDDYNHRLTDAGGITVSAKKSTGDAGEAMPALKKIVGLLLSEANDGALTPEDQDQNAEKEKVNNDASKTGDASEKTALKDFVSANAAGPSETDGKPRDGKPVVYVDQSEGQVYSEKQNRLAANVRRARRVFKAVKGIQAFSRQARASSLDSLNMGADLTEVAASELRPTSIGDELGLQGSAKYWIGKDYTNFIFKDLTELHQPFVDIVDRNITPRMPWHDIGAVVCGSAARDVARHFIQRWNFTKFEKAKQHENYPWLFPKSYSDADSHICLPEAIFGKIYTANCQILRSASNWSVGIKAVEKSIHSAYVNAIINAKHYIYIENQFFIALDHNNPSVQNEIGEALYRRIMRAHSNKETFRVYVVMPLMPAFEGEVGTDTGVAIQAITHWNYASMCRGSSSLIGRLSVEIADPTQYIDFFGLRTHDELHENLVTELVYVHSKLMIVDDEITIIGSANINDRSMLGKRDSELAVIVNDVDHEKSIMNGRIYSAGRYSGSLRRTLFREHLGIMENDFNIIDVRDPVCESFYNGVWRKTAENNTAIYEKVFHCIPSDSTKTFAELKEYTSEKGLAQSDLELAKQELREVKGHVVIMPKDFLVNEDLTPASGTKEALMPEALWT